jgi:hypothetical protein
VLTRVDRCSTDFSQTVVGSGHNYYIYLGAIDNISPIRSRESTGLSPRQSLCSIENRICARYQLSLTQSMSTFVAD